MPVPLSDEEYRLLSELLSQEFGLWFGPERREILRTRLEPRRAELGFRSFHDLFFHLKFHPDREAERLRLVPYLTNNESYFFRERAQLDFFRDRLLAEAARELAASGRQEFRILSAGCSAGQEPYTLAMMLREARLPAGIRPRITGVDLDPRVLEDARAARYTAHSFRGVDPVIRERHFRPVSDSEWELEAGVRDSVEFRKANLADPSWPRLLPPQDVVFCRNVLIYFDQEALRRAAQGLHEVLAPGGRLFLGHAESLNRVPTPLVARRHPGVIFYEKPRTSAGSEPALQSRTHRERVR
jgi:chemotaxis protein methyltransferase CheR